MTHALVCHRILFDDAGTAYELEAESVNKAFEKLMGAERTDLIGKKLADWSLDETHEIGVICEQFKAMLTVGKDYSAEMHIENKDIWYRMDGRFTEDHHLITEFVEITDLKLLHLQGKRVMDHCEEMIFSLDATGHLTSFNKCFAQTMVGAVQESIENRHFEKIGMHPSLSAAWKRHFHKAVQNTVPLSFESIVLLPECEDRCYKTTFTPIVKKNGKIIGVSGYQRDVTQLKHQEKTIRKLAYQDALTGLPNRALFMDRLSSALSLAERRRKRTAVLFVDLDDFKIINDTLGHLAGDELLMQASQRIQTCTRAYDTVARLGGDEFAIVLQDVDHAEDVIPFINRLNSTFAKPMNILDNKLHITASIGVSVFPDDSETVEDLMRHADTAMVRAKSMGKNMYQYFNVSMKEEIIKKMNIEGMLREALINDEFVLHYQPQIDSNGRKLRGFEALIRWQHPQLGLLSPIEFIPIAESTGMIVDIGTWVIKEACDMCKTIQEIHGAPLIMAVNISTIQLRAKNFYDIVMDVLQTSGLQPSSLELEITESVVIDDYERTEVVLTKLRDVGVRVALDDFGTGYSSLSYLKKLPIDLLKIDRSFVWSIDLNNKKQDLTGSIISLVHKLEIETMAEGVENIHQLEHLIDMKCDHLQGYYFSEPVTAGQMNDCLKRWHLPIF